MTDERLSELRPLVRAGELPGDLVDELRSVVRGVVRRRLLPPSFAPYGQWDEEAADELFQSWYTERLLGQGHMQLLLDRARTAGGLRRLAERSLRHHLINSKDRSQAHNLYRRVVALLEDEAWFRLVRDAARAQDRWYVSADSLAEVALWAGDDRVLIAHAWALGDFVVIRYRAAANKLSPVLEIDELRRFVSGLLSRVPAALTPGLIMRALAGRFDLGETEFVEHEDESASTPAVAPVQEEVLLRDLARTIVAELSTRQLTILQRSATEGVASIAAAVGCSVGTVVNEQRRVGELVSRLTENEQERDRVLNIVVDITYEDDDE
ncbi:MAG: hypothetical protein ACR2LV_02845 [Solirubrobacteraceae bacterium]